MKDLKLKQSAEKIFPEQLEIFKNKFDLTLPKSYEDFISENNGGYPEISAFDNPNEDGSIINVFCCVRIEEPELDFLNPTPRLISSKSLIESHQILEKNISKYLYPFALDEGGGKFCISMREEDFGSIYQVFLDGTVDEPVYVTDSFENFINGLEDPSIYDVD
ncbi:SMI1/KNR4 family protein [uncultured Dokdonia sp.]|uniref:SMI1/KNR4 family protein n=1 Tax=uncultured Dokdonia sp. TaxID=575653 RepID=UPI0026281925|nr:SMI1/KNR4 family protein [uncultured Dokdonia sp.]